MQQMRFEFLCIFLVLCVQSIRNEHTIYDVYKKLLSIDGVTQKCMTLHKKFEGFENIPIHADISVPKTIFSISSASNDHMIEPLRWTKVDDTTFSTVIIHDATEQFTVKDGQYLTHPIIPALFKSVPSPVVNLKVAYTDPREQVESSSHEISPHGCLTIQWDHSALYTQSASSVGFSIAFRYAAINAKSRIPFSLPGSNRNHDLNQDWINVCEDFFDIHTGLNKHCSLSSVKLTSEHNSNQSGTRTTAFSKKSAEINSEFLDHQFDGTAKLPSSSLFLSSSPISTSFEPLQKITQSHNTRHFYKICDLHSGIPLDIKVTALSCDGAYSVPHILHIHSPPPKPLASLTAVFPSDQKKNNPDDNIADRMTLIVSPLGDVDTGAMDLDVMTYLYVGGSLSLMSRHLWSMELQKQPLTLNFAPREISGSILSTIFKLIEPILSFMLPEKASGQSNTQRLTDAGQFWNSPTSHPMTQLWIVFRSPGGIDSLPRKLDTPILGSGVILGSKINNPQTTTNLDLMKGGKKIFVSTISSLQPNSK